MGTVLPLYPQGHPWVLFCPLFYPCTQVRLYERCRRTCPYCAGHSSCTDVCNTDCDRVWVRCTGAITLTTRLVPLAFSATGGDPTLHSEYPVRLTVSAGPPTTHLILNLCTTATVPSSTQAQAWHSIIPQLPQGMLAGEAAPQWEQGWRVGSISGGIMQIHT